MRHRLFWLSALLLCSVGALLAQEGSPVNNPASDGVALTVYNWGSALVRDRRTFTLSEGVNRLDFNDVASSIDPTSVTFVSLSDPQGTRVLEQNYVYDLVDGFALLNRYLDQRIRVTVDDGTVYEGQLLSSRGSDIILRADDGQVILTTTSQIRDIQFPSLPDGLITRPTLRWLLQSASSGPQQVELTYLTGNITWTADYNILLANDNASLDLNGWITLGNTSGTSYRDALLKLVAGDVNRLPEYEAQTMMDAMAAPTMAMRSAPQVEQRNIFEYKLYEIQRPVTIANNETKQVEFVAAANVPAKVIYVYDANPYFYGYYGPVTDQYYGQSGITDVGSFVEFTTGEDKGLGADLPAGRVRVYQQDSDGAAVLIGENRIDHTPKGEDVRFLLGNAFDLVGERVQTSFRIVSERVIQETYQITLRNRKADQAVEIRVPEKLFRWSNWQILSHSLDYTQIDSSTIEFRPIVPPNGEVVITYTVQYSW
ncbi:MAG: DUF4139 domain-containing protein [Anaerolineae bacterium]|nr:DUF4139 domain-containing protein [Anaerolineae bacterium]MDW8172199.1 DUF4139 domain-containing protein [Anaerolineae bacterium]